MKTSTVPDGLPVLSRGRHRTPKRGACFMELASLLAGERWSDHPACTHPLLGQLARQVNDLTSDDGRRELTPLIPSVVGRRGDDRTWLAVSVAVAARLILDQPEGAQRVLAAGLIKAEELGQTDPDLTDVARQARAALDLVPGAVAWVEGLGVHGEVTRRTYAERCAPTLVRDRGRGHRDRRRRAARPAAARPPRGRHRRLPGRAYSTPAARAASAYAAASVATVSWALSPLGLGTTHSSAPGERLRADDRVRRARRPNAVRYAVIPAIATTRGRLRRDGLDQLRAAGAQLVVGELGGPRGRAADEVGDADAAGPQPVAVLVGHPR